MKAQEPVLVSMGHRQDSWPAPEGLPAQGKPLGGVAEDEPGHDEQNGSVQSEQTTAPDTPTTPTTQKEEATNTEEKATQEESAGETKEQPKMTEAEEKAAARTATMVKKIDLVANIIEQELDELSEEQLENLSPTLRRQIEILRKMAEESRKDPNEEEKKEEESTENAENQTDEDEEADLVYEVKKYTMDEWKKMKHEEKRPLISAYYRSIPQSTSHIGKGPISSSKERHERPQRIKIASNVLLDELEDLSDVIVPTYAPFVLAPPYKLLVKYRPDMLEREAELQKELEEVKKTIEDGKEAETQTESQTSPATLSQQSSTTGSDSNPNKPSKPPLKLAAAEDPAKKQRELTRRYEQLSLLNSFVETELGSYLDIQEKIAAGTLEKIAFEDLWYIFQPGEMLFFPQQGHEQLCRIFSFTGGQQRKRAPNRGESTTYYRDEGDIIHSGSGRGTWTPVKLDFYMMEFNGRIVGPKGGAKYIRHYAGEFKITDLPIYPLRFHKQKDAVLKRLVARGYKYISSYGHKSYRGITSPPNDQISPEEVHGEIFLDLKEYYRHHSHEKPELGVLHRTSPDEAEAEEPAGPDSSWLFCDPEVDQQATDRFMLLHHNELEPVELEVFLKSEKSSIPLFPFRMPAYAFRTRQYIYVNIDIVTEIDKSDRVKDGGFDDLVIPDSHREILTALVKNKVQEPPTTRLGADIVEEEETPTQIDIVRGKGKGLIILLHGPPGSGKTSTAETLAAFTRRPLYPITCGDLGTGPIEVERTLTEHTERAQRWGCILLLDEADVFLTRRDWRDTVHNALVSVFLRQLEYYSGILFLTTNRVGVIDEAFKSRIHVSLAYPTIRLQETIDIWKGILRRIERDNRASKIQIRFKFDNLLSFARSHYRQHERTGTTWNGRQIRNAFQLAVALGHYERDKKLAEAGLTSEEAIATKEKKWLTVKLTTDSFRSIARTARDFEDYLVAVRGSDSEIARNMYLRHDEQVENERMMDVGSGSLAPAVWARKDYGRQQQPSLLTPPRNAQAAATAAPGSPGRRSRSGSHSQGRGRKVKGDEEADERQEEEEEDSLDEFSSDEDY